MKIDTTLWFFNKLIKDNLCTLYSGFFSEDILRKVMDISELSIGGLEEFKKKKKRMLFLMAEGFQNIIKHGEKPKINGNGIDSMNFFLTLNRENAIFISTGNLIENTNVADLQKQLIEVNSLDEDGLKELHSYVMKHGSLSHKGGAGLGLISIARKADQKLSYSFEAYKKDLSLYYNQIVLKANDEIPDDEINALFPIAEAIEFHKKMIAENVVMIQKGDFSEDAQNSIMQIIEDNIKYGKGESEFKSEFYKFLMNIIQNIDKHGMEINSKKDGILLIGKKDEHYIINTGNFICYDKINALENRLLELNKQKADGNLPENSDQGIGFIEIARRSKEPFQFSFDKIEQEKYFFTLSVTI